MPEYLTPGVYFEVRDPAPTVRGIRTDIAGFVGLAERGPVDTPVRVESWRQFQALFGSLVSYAYLAYGVKAFFDNGGRTCFIVRAATNTARAATRTLVNKAAQDVMLVSASSPGTWGGTVSVTIVDVNAADKTFSLRVTHGSDMELFRNLSTDPANELYFQTIVNEGSEYIRPSRWITLQPVASPPADMLPDPLAAGLVGRTTFLDDLRLPLKNIMGADAFVLSGTGGKLQSGEVAVVLDNVNSGAGTFRLSFAKGTEIETYPGLSINPLSATYVCTVLNTGGGGMGPSRWVRAALADDPPSDLVPDAAASGMPGGLWYLTAGRDGIATLAAEDLIGDTTVPTPELRGLAALAAVDEVAILAMPDIHIRPTPKPTAPPMTQPPPRDPCLYPPPLPFAGNNSALLVESAPGFGESDVLRLQQAMVLQCEQLKDRFAVLDAPLNPSNNNSLTVTEITAKRMEFESERGFAALYYPWVKVVDPVATGSAVVRAIPPSGHIAGLYARIDTTIGVHKAPANAELEWAEDVTVEIGEAEQGILNPIGVNCIRAFPGRGIRVFGARTISSNADWRYVNVRRLLMMIEEAVDQSTQWAVFEPHNVLLRQGLAASVGSYLNALWRKGSLAGSSAEEAYFVRCDDSNNPQASVDQGKIIIDIGVAPAIPAEFVIFRIGRTSEELELVER